MLKLTVLESNDKNESTTVIFTLKIIHLYFLSSAKTAHQKVNKI